MKTKGCHLKEIKKKILLDADNFDKKTMIVHVRTIEDDRNGLRSFKATEDFTGNRTEESYITGSKPKEIEMATSSETEPKSLRCREMTSGEIMEFEKVWKKMWHPKLTHGESTNL